VISVSQNGVAPSDILHRIAKDDLTHQPDNFMASRRELGPMDHPFYDSLRHPDDICVLHLNPGAGDDGIQCRLEVRRFHRETANSQRSDMELDCTALSYLWGDDQNNLQIIQCNGVDFVVTYHLYQALHHLLLADCLQTFWIDALCINQNNNE
jgi:hypothetical protein